MTEDERLIALIDNELDDEARAALAARLAEDAALRTRLDDLRRSRGRITAAFDALLGQAPIEKLRSALPPIKAAALPSTPHARFAWRELAAGITIGAVLTGIAAWAALGSLGSPTPEAQEDWRSAVLEYARLYTPATFAFPAPDPRLATEQLQTVSDKVGVSLTTQSIAVPGLEYKTAINFAFGGDPLAEIAYTDEKGDPVLFCVIADRKPSATANFRKYDGFSTATWSRNGRSYMVVAQQPEARVAEIARAFEARF
jgi:anti-sigma factor RsiW